MRGLLKRVVEAVSIPDTNNWRKIIADIKAELAKPEAESFEIEWPEYHEQGMGCGLEDRGITDRYDAMRYGWDEALDAVGRSLPEKIYTHPPKQPLSEDEEMALFEKWASDPVRVDRLPDLRHSNGAYMDSRTYIAWYAWKGKAALVSS